jgi:ethanolamine utilization protein EutA
MAELALLLVEGRSSALADRLYQTPPAPPPSGARSLMLSGGIGYYYYEPISLATVSDVARHGDLGPLLAESLRLSPAFGAHKILRPKETRRATVLGASAQTLSLSGSTIWADSSILPLKNVPVIRPRLEPGPGGEAGLSDALGEALGRWDFAPVGASPVGASPVGADPGPFAVSLPIERILDYAALERLAAGLADFARPLPRARPLIVIIRQDYAQVLGQTLKALCPERPLIVLDQVGIEEGDYIDIGLPLMDGRVVPLVVKTLIFYH